MKSEWVAGFVSESMAGFIGIRSHGNSLAAHIAIACILIVHCHVERQQIVPGPKTRCLMMVGVLAYGIYAWHGLILVVWPSMTDHFLLTYTASLALAAASHIGFEDKLASRPMPFVRQDAVNQKAQSSPL